MNPTAFYQAQAAYCLDLLRRPVEPRRRALIERERQDWMRLADHAGLRTDGEARAAPQARTFAAARRPRQLQED